MHLVVLMPTPSNIALYRKYLQMATKPEVVIYRYQVA